MTKKLTPAELAAIRERFDAWELAYGEQERELTNRLLFDLESLLLHVEALGAEVERSDKLLDAILEALQGEPEVPEMPQLRRTSEDIKGYVVVDGGQTARDELAGKE